MELGVPQAREWCFSASWHQRRRIQMFSDGFLRFKGNKCRQCSLGSDSGRDLKENWVKKSVLLLLRICSQEWGKLHWAEFSLCKKGNTGCRDYFFFSLPWATLGGSKRYTSLWHPVMSEGKAYLCVHSFLDVAASISNWENVVQQYRGEQGLSLSGRYRNESVGVSFKSSAVPRN